MRRRKQTTYRELIERHQRWEKRPIPLTAAQLDDIVADITGDAARLAGRKAVLLAQLAEYLNERIARERFPFSENRFKRGTDGQCQCNSCQHIRENLRALQARRAAEQAERDAASTRTP